MRTPNVLRKVKIEGKWRMLPVASTGSGLARRFDFSKVMLGGKPIVADAGTFYLEFWENGKRRRAVGTHPRDVKTAMMTQASVLGLRAQGVIAADAPQIRARKVPQGKTIGEVVSAFLKAPRLGLRATSIAKYSNALQSFATWAAHAKLTHASQIDRDELLAFMADAVKRTGLDISTAVDKAVIVKTQMNRAGAKIVMEKGDWPKVTRTDPEVYAPDTLKRLFAVCRPDELALYQTFLFTGMREQEVGFLSWEDFDERRSTLRVSKKPQLGFDVKNYQERTVPIPKVLVATLAAHRERQRLAGMDDPYLIFPTGGSNRTRGLPGGQRDGKMLDRLKGLAKRAGLNCGRCAGRFRGEATTCARHPICGNFGLHRFRHTYATTLLRDGVDIVSLQKLLGHKDLDSTKVYLRALEPEDLLAKINQTSLATRFV